MTKLEELELQTGGTYTVTDWHRARRTCAAARTDLDLALIEHFEGTAQYARALPQRSAELAPAAAPLLTKAETRPAPVDRPVTRPMLQKSLQAVATTLAPILRQQKADLAQLTATVQTLADRVLQLEATHAAATPVSDDELTGTS
jgi:hypothetical protein